MTIALSWADPLERKAPDASLRTVLVLMRPLFLSSPESIRKLEKAVAVSGGLFGGFSRKSPGKSQENCWKNPACPHLPCGGVFRNRQLQPSRVFQKVCHFGFVACEIGRGGLQDSWCVSRRTAEGGEISACGRGRHNVLVFF